MFYVMLDKQTGRVMVNSENSQCLIFDDEKSAWKFYFTEMEETYRSQIKIVEAEVSV